MFSTEIVAHRGAGESRRLHACGSACSRFQISVREVERSCLCWCHLYAHMVVVTATVTATATATPGGATYIRSAVGALAAQSSESPPYHVRLRHCTRRCVLSLCVLDSAVVGEFAPKCLHHAALRYRIPYRTEANRTCHTVRYCTAQQTLRCDTILYHTMPYTRDCKVPFAVSAASTGKRGALLHKSWQGQQTRSMPGGRVR